MSLHKKTLIIIGMTIVCLIMLPFFMLRGILHESVAKLEAADVRQDVKHARTGIDSDLTDLDTLAYDWAAWDDTYAFIDDRSKEYAQSNLPDTVLSGLKVDIMLLVNKSGEVVFAKTCDEPREREFDIPDATVKEILGNTMIMHHEDVDSRKTGILMLAEGPLAFCSRPVIKSSGEGPINGTILFGRYLRKPEIAKLEERTHLSLYICALNEEDMPTGCREAVSALNETDIFVRPLDQQKIAGYAILNDFYGKPALVLRVESPREIYQQDKANVAQFILYFLPVGLLFGAATLFLVERLVVSRLSRLSKDVSAIGASGNLAARLKVTGKDELANVAGEINQMLAALEKSEVVVKTNEELAAAKKNLEEAAARLKKEREFSERIVETAKAMLVVLDREGRIVLCNAFAAELTGYARDEMIGKNWFETFLPLNERHDVLDTFHKLLDNAMPNTRENPVLCKTGEVKFIMWSNAVLRNEDGSVMGTLSVGNNITERQRAEAALRESQEELKHAKDLAEAANRELARNVKELEAFNKLAVGREVTMIELKRRVNVLCEKLGDKPPYNMSMIGTANGKNGNRSNGEPAENGSEEK